MTDNEIIVGSGNVYEDIGVKNASVMLVKAQLAGAIQDILDARGLAQTQAAHLMGLPQPKLSLLLKGQFRGISEFKMLVCIARLGRDVWIVIADGRSSDNAMGRIEVQA